MLQRIKSASAKTVRRAISAVEDLIWPSGFQCLCCEKPSHGESLCPACRKSLNELRQKNETGDVRSVWKYAGSAKKLVTELKFNCSANCADVLAAGMADVIRQMAVPSNAVLTWVTMPKKRKGDRGIDHGMELCRRVSEMTGLRMCQLLERKGAAQTQRGLNKEQRMINLRRVFTCSCEITGSVLLADDVLTTGATIRACKEALLEAGAERVYAVTATSAEIKANSMKG